MRDLLQRREFYNNMILQPPIFIGGFFTYKDIILLSNPWKTREIKQYQQILRCKKVTFEQGRCLKLHGAHTVA